ncbi:MAG: hypothetical protein V2I26_12200 [Halieaceae bacterium]|jgi:hypothetical protein|nr:hypothetical protein [Halieaceae bacterium]
MDARYNIYFAGQLLEGQDLAAVRARIGKLFNADAATLDKLFSGNTQLLKRDCDKATALKYKQAMEQAGALPVIKASAANTTTAAPPAPAPVPAPAKAMTAAEKIAALAAAADLTARPREPAPAPPPADPAPAADGAIALAPAGTAVLLPSERPGVVTSEVVPPDLEVMASGQRLSEQSPAAPPPPDTSHLSEGIVGELLPRLPSSAAVLAPDTSGIQLTPDGTDLSDCAAPPQAPPALDLSGIVLAPAGADVLEQQYRNRPAPPPPATEHLKLED